MSSLFDLYSNAGEYKNPLPDVFGRARYFNSGNSGIFSPAISKEIYSKGFQPHYPDRKKFAVCISHDIDFLYLRQSLKRRVVNTAKDLLKAQFRKGWVHFKSLPEEKIHDGYNLKRLIQINNQHHIKSTYYFLALQNGEQDFNYDLGKIAEQLQYVVKNGNEIGLHGGHYAYNNKEKLLKEKLLLEENSGIKVHGYRNHYLRFAIPTTWNNLEQAGFLYDSTLGYADCVGFRNGMCYPFSPFDIEKNDFLDIVELPLIVMDATLFYYMRLDPDIAFKICKDLIDQVKECQGVFTLLWHNNSLNGEMGSLYLKLLEYLKGEDPWFTTSLDLVKWWKEEKLLEQSREIVKELIAR
jgi:hypothetical protein